MGQGDLFRQIDLARGVLGVRPSANRFPGSKVEFSTVHIFFQKTGRFLKSYGTLNKNVLEMTDAEGRQTKIRRAASRTPHTQHKPRRSGPRASSSARRKCPRVFGADPKATSATPKSAVCVDIQLKRTCCGRDFRSKLNRKVRFSAC